MSNTILKRELHGLRLDLDIQIKEVQELAAKIGCRPTQVQDANGGYMMAPLLAAKAHVLSALVVLEKT